MKVSFLISQYSKLNTPTISKVYSNATISIKKCGRTITLRVDATLPSTTGWLRIANNVPKPVVSQIIALGIYNSGVPCSSFMSIHDNGSLDIIVNSLDTNTSVVFTETYLTSDY